MDNCAKGGRVTYRHSSPLFKKSKGDVMKVRCPNCHGTVNASFVKWSPDTKLLEVNIPAHNPAQPWHKR